MAQQDPRLASYSKWLIANQDRRDTPEFQKVANAYKQIRANSLSQPQQVTQTSADQSNASGDLKAGMLMAKTIIPGIKAAKQISTVGTATSDVASQTQLEKDASYFDQQADAYEAELSMLEAADPDAAAQLRDEIKNLRQQANDRRSFASTPSAQQFQSDLDVAASDATQKLAGILPTIMDLSVQASEIPLNPSAAKMFNPQGEGFLAKASDAFDSFNEDRLGVGRTVLLRTLPAMAPAVATAIVGTALGGPQSGALLASLVGGSTELGIAMSQDLARTLGSEGVNVQDKDALEAWFKANPDRMMQMVADARNRALAIGATELAFGSAAGRVYSAAQNAANPTKLKNTGAILAGTGLETTGEVAGEALATAVTDQEQNPGELLASALAAGPISGVQAFGQTRSMFKKDGTIVDPESLSSQEKRAAADVARMLRSVAGTDGYNLKDVSTGKKSAKAALEAVRGQIVQNIKNLSSLDGIRERLDPKKAASLDQLLEQINPATSAVAAGKTKVARSVTEEQFAAIKRLLPPTKEAGELLNALRMSNITTELFQKGQKGGISQYTDVFLPTKMDGGYSISRGIQNASFGPAAFLTDGTTLGIGVGGRVIDKVTGRRSIIDRFVRKNENKEGLADPGGPSLIALKKLQKDLEQQKLDASKQETLELNRALYDEGVDPAGLDGTMDKASPEAQMMLALEVNTPDGRFGPDRTTINSAVQAIIDNPDSPKALVKAAETYLTNIRDGGKIPKLTPLIQAVKREIKNNPEVYGRTRASQLSQGPAFDLTVPRPLTVSDGSVSTNSPAYQAGIQRNLTRVDNQRALLNANPTIPAVEKAQLNESLNRLRQPLTNPVVAVQQEIQRLNELGVDPASIDLVLSPIQEAVTSQQRQAQGLQTPTEITQRPALETVAPAPAEAQTEAPAALTQPAPSDPVSMTVRANLLTRTVREIAEGNMTPSQVEILLSQLEQSYPGIKAEVEAIIGSQQQQQQQQPAALQQPSTLQLTPEMQVQPSLELTPEMRQSAEAPSVNNTQPVLPYMQQETVEDDTKFDMEPPAIPALSQEVTPPTFEQSASLSSGVPKVFGQIKSDENKDGFMPHLRVYAPTFREGKPLFTIKTNNKNAARQIDNIDEVLSRHPDPAQSSQAWSDMLGDALASNDIPVQPHQFINDINNGGAQALLSKLTPGQIADADHGFANAKEFRRAYTNGEIGIEDTGRLFLWSFLSRGVSPYTQEGLFIDSFSGIEEWIRAAAGKSNKGHLKDRLKEYKKWASKTAPKGSGQPGSGAMHNLNAFGNTFLLKMSQDAGLGDGRSRLQVIHDMMSDPNTTGKEVRRQFLRMGEGVGIDNKVVSFTLLVAGYDDVMVLDRVQMRQMWNDGRFDGLNLYDGYKSDGNPVTGSSLSNLTYGARGLLIYEALEKSLQQRLAQIYGDVGRPDAASVGRYHWETWVASSQQEASHATIDAILARAKGDANPLDGVMAKEGEYGAFAYGAKYGIIDGKPGFVYNIPNAGDFKFTVPQFKAFLEDIKKAKNKVIPSKFKVTDSGNAPWYTREEVNLDALTERAKEYGKQIRGTDAELREGEAVPDGRPVDAPVLRTADDREPGLLPALREGRDKLGAIFSRVPQRQEVVNQFPAVKAAIQVGKKGTEYENGVNDIEGMFKVAEALNVVIHMFHDQQAMADAKGVENKGTVRGSFRKTPNGSSGTVFALKEGTPFRDSRITNLEELTTVAHELMHGLNMGPMSGVGPMLNGNGNGTPSIENAIGVMLEKPQGKRTRLEREIIFELKNLQNNISVYLESNPKDRRPVRVLNRQLEEFAQRRGQMTPEDQMAYEDRLDKYKNYIRSKAELTVDGAWVYLVNPKLAKQVMPNFTKWFSGELRKAGNKNIQFYSHPFAVSVAVMLAILAAQDAEDEEKKQQQQQQQPMMQPGALSPMPGMLTAA